MDDQRLASIKKFYSILDALENVCGGGRVLADCSGYLSWPTRGVYFFREPGEMRTDSGSGPRVVRVGTHALTGGSGTTLWKRLSQHRGASGGRGNHRGSIFRLIVGNALLAKCGYQYSTWGVGSSAPAKTRAGEGRLEAEVSQVIGAMTLLWLAVEDPPGADSQRGYIERNSIALLSNYSKPSIDAPSSGWLGRHCDRERVQNSGLWNSNHVDEEYDPPFLDRMNQLVDAMTVSA
jgi:hypothetical protein